MHEKFKRLILKGKSKGGFTANNGYGNYGNMEYSSSVIGQRGLIQNECMYVSVRSKYGGWRQFLLNKWRFEVEMSDSDGVDHMYHTKCQWDEDAMEAKVADSSSVISAPVASSSSSFSSVGVAVVSAAGKLPKMHWCDLKRHRCSADCYCGCIGDCASKASILGCCNIHRASNQA